MTYHLNLDLDELPIECALGIQWSVEDDTLGFKIRSLVRHETKGGILSTVCTLFDPLGFAAPVALTALCLVQDLWKADVGWDEPLSKDFCLSRERRTLSYTCCLSFGSISCLTVTCVNAIYSFMCFQMRQRLVVEGHHICEVSTTMDEFIAPSSLQS